MLPLFRHLYIKTILVFAGALCILGMAFPQSFKGLSIPENTYSYGTVKVWDNPPAVFTFENTSFDPMYILAPKAGRNVMVEYPRNKIESGEKGEIRVYFYTNKTGNFSEEILLYASTSNEPVKLTIKGQIKALAENALTECPTFDNNPDKNNQQDYVIEGIVIDKITKLPIANSIVRFANVESIYTNNKGEFKQKIPVGLYISLAQAKGYRDLNLMVGVKKDMDRIVYELLPYDVQPLEKDTLPVFVDTIRVDTQQIVKVDSIPVLPDENPDFTYKEYRANNIVFLIDVSGSMKQKGKIDSLKTAMLYMAEALRSVDRISVITFATSTSEVMTNIPGNNKDLIMPTINGLVAKGTTNGVLGLERAYATALEQYIDGGNNQVIVVTDGIFNGTNSSPGAVIDLIKAYKARGVVLSVVGFGKDQDAVSQMKKMAELGQGSFIPFENSNSAKPVLIQEIKNRSKR